MCVFSYKKGLAPTDSGYYSTDNCRVAFPIGADKPFEAYRKVALDGFPAYPVTDFMVMNMRGQRTEAQGTVTVTYKP